MSHATLKAALDEYLTRTVYSDGDATGVFLHSVNHWYSVRGDWTDKQVTAIERIIFGGKSRIMSMSVSQRALVRSTIAKHPDYRASGLPPVQTMKPDALVAAAKKLGIDVDALLNRTPALQAPFFGTPQDVAPRAPSGNPDAPASEVDMGDIPERVRSLEDFQNRASTHLGSLSAELAKLSEAAPKRLDIVQNGVVAPVEGIAHPMLETLIKVISGRDVAGRHPNVWIAGPTGSGKTFAAEQAANALGLPFGTHGAMTMPHDLIGFVDAGGTYHQTQFVTRYREGGIVLLDEMDAGTNEAAIALQGALAGNSMPLPTGEIVQRHPDFACIAAGNTYGAGATAEFVGRNKLDNAFLSRFPVKLTWGYDAAFEFAMCGPNAREWVEMVQKARAHATAQGLKLIIDPRVSLAGTSLISSGFTLAQAAELTFLASLKEDAKRAMKLAVMGL